MPVEALQVGDFKVIPIWGQTHNAPEQECWSILVVMWSMLVHNAPHNAGNGREGFSQIQFAWPYHRAMKNFGNLKSLSMITPAKEAPFIVMSSYIKERESNPFSSSQHGFFSSSCCRFLFSVVFKP